MKPWLKNTLAGATLLVGVGGTIVYNQYLSPIINDAPAYVATRNIEPNTVIQAGDIKAVHVPRAIVVPSAISDPNAIVGKMAAQTIVVNQQITPVDLETDPLVPQKGQYIVPIISQWIAAMPDSLRRGDKVTIYVRPAPSSTSGTSPTAPPAVSQHSTPAPTAPNNFMSQVSQEPLLQDVPVEFVRNGSNQEVQNAPPVTLGGGVLAERQNGTANPSEMELLMTKTDWDKLYAAVQANNQLVFVYAPNK
ncbi:SAF domain-containing protein [Alicyclobacillus macrosporangiidus]|uniref:Pilus assembly protein CpaB n=1 Tax=Alicyclobacillus macrosporangiidus TaxID=392015 RepID=A0A1I7L1L4_9BACL|nr:SAF domain-containing protein [Alicyclobacillus macrosporangiidus]SFV03662.1 pilus assembly protein CpaB [Alicyclobacillus macrosporangiidus]